MKFFRKNFFSAQVDLGISFHGDGIALARLDRDKSPRPVLRHARFIPAADPSAGARQLRDALRRENLFRPSCVVVLGLGDYQLLQVEPPEIPEREMHSALRWQVRDLLNYPVEEAVLDYFSVPRQGSRNPVAYAVVARRKTLAQRIDLVREAKINISAVDIPEMALRHIGALLPESGPGAAFLYLAAENGLILLLRDGVIYLARKLGFGLNGFAAASGGDRDAPFKVPDEDGGVMEEIFARLVLEVQRSLDYFESTFRLPPIASLVIAPLQGEGDGAALFATLQSGLAIPCRWLDLRQLVANGETLPLPGEERCLAAIGAALRGMAG